MLKSQFHNMCMIWIDLNMISRWSELMIKLDETSYNFYSKTSVYSKIYVIYFNKNIHIYFILYILHVIFYIVKWNTSYLAKFIIPYFIIIVSYFIL